MGLSDSMFCYVPNAFLTAGHSNALRHGNDVGTDTETFRSRRELKMSVTRILPIHGTAEASGDNQREQLGIELRQPTRVHGGPTVVGCRPVGRTCLTFYALQSVGTRKAGLQQPNIDLRGVVYVRHIVRASASADDGV